MCFMYCNDEKCIVMWQQSMLGVISIDMHRTMDVNHAATLTIICTIIEWKCAKRYHSPAHVIFFIFLHGLWLGGLPYLSFLSLSKS